MMLRGKFGIRRFSAVVPVIAAYLIVGVGAAGASSNSDAIPVKVTFTATGSASIDESYVSSDGNCTVQSQDSFPLSWEADFRTTLTNGKLAGGTGTLAGPPGSFAFSATSSGTQGCDQVAPLAAPPCSGPLSATAPPTLGVSTAGAGDNGPQNVEVAPIPALSAPSCPKPEFPERDFSVFNASLPGATTGEATIPAGALTEGATFTTTVGSGAAPTQMSGDCSGVGQIPQGMTACTQSLSWSGTLKVAPDCGAAAPPDGTAAKVTFKEGPVSGIGSDGTVVPGQSITTGPGGRVDLTLPDGSSVRIGPNSKAQIPPCMTPDDQGNDRLTFKLLLGEIWAKVNDALGGSVPIETERAAGGVRGSSITYSVDRHGATYGHVVEGRGWMRPAGDTEVYHYRAGQTFILPVSGPARLTYNWPSADRALVPRADLKASAKLVCTVPKLKGLPLKAATKALKKSGCAIGRVIKPRHIARHAKLVVRRANPSTGATAAKHTKIKLTLGAAARHPKKSH
jgi:hypothetical protein